MTQPQTNPGARPANEATEAAAAAHVQSLFNTIAPTYDRLNHLLSFGLDCHWWRKSARAFATTLALPEARVLDLCCGTGDMTAALLNERPAERPIHHNTVISTEGALLRRSGETRIPSTEPEGPPQPITGPDAAEPITGLDFSPEMLARARTKYPTPQILWVEGDAMHLPYADNTFDLVTSAFGFRNLSNYTEALREIHRVLAPGGQLGILECNHPAGLNGLVYNLYLHHGLPLIGGLISGERAAYRYLPASIARFPRPPQMLQMLAEAGFRDSAWRGYLFHAAGLYRSTK